MLLHYYVQKGISLEALKKASLIDKKFYMASFLATIEAEENRGGEHQWQAEQ